MHVYYNFAGARHGCSQPRTTLMVAWWEFDAEQQQQLGQRAAQQAQRASQPGEPDAVGGGGPMQLPPWRLAACGAAGKCPALGLLMVVGGAI